MWAILHDQILLELVTWNLFNLFFIYLYIIFGPLAVIFLVETKHSFSKFHKNWKFNLHLAIFKIIHRHHSMFTYKNYIGFSFNSELCDLAEKYGALTFIDECHATGFLGDTGR